jgi:hypothetical protein
MIKSDGIGSKKYNGDIAGYNEDTSNLGELQARMMLSKGNHTRLFSG